jgi:hypothetical protein
MKPNYNLQRENSPVRQQFFKRLLYIALCIIPIILFADNKDSFRLVPLPFFIFGMIQLLTIVAGSQQILDDFFPPKTKHEKKARPRDKFIYYFSMTLFFVGLVFEVFEIRTIDNTINGMSLFWKSAFLGLIIAFLSILFIKSFSPTVFDESNRRYSVYLGLYLGFFLFVPAFASFLNHYFADEKMECKSFEIIRKNKGGKRNTSSLLHIKIDPESEERFEVSKQFYELVAEGEKIKLCTIKGKLGYHFVEKFETINE